jgi:hypothetical protein
VVELPEDAGLQRPTIGVVVEAEPEDYLIVIPH